MLSATFLRFDFGFAGADALLALGSWALQNFPTAAPRGPEIDPQLRSISIVMLPSRHI